MQAAYKPQIREPFSSKSSSCRAPVQVRVSLEGLICVTAVLQFSGFQPKQRDGASKLPRSTIYISFIVHEKTADVCLGHNCLFVCWTMLT